MNKKYIITGISTDVGKTVVSAIIAEMLRASYWKPIQAGDLESSDSLKVGQLTEHVTILPEVYRLNEAMSPHAAAELDGVEIKLENLQLPDVEGNLIIEGAGGLMVPLNKDGLSYADVIEYWSLPTIIVSKHYLGSINHTLLTVDLMKHRGIEIAGIVFVGEENLATETIIAESTGVEILGRIPWAEKLDRTFVREQSSSTERSSLANLQNLQSPKEHINKSTMLIQQDRACVWHPFTQHLTAGNPLDIVRAEGIWLYDSNGKKFLDANSSWWVNTHGHGHPHIGKAMNKQFQAIDHVVFAGVTHPKAVELAARITQLLPDSLTKVFFSDNGSTSVEVALKMAIQYWFNKGEKRQRILALQGSYHGDTFGAMSVGQRGYFNEPFESFFFDVDYLDFPTGENEKELLRHAEHLFSSDDFAGIIVEPLVQGAAGMQMYSAEFLDALTNLARANNVLVIFDEVMTGFGRTGKLFAMDYCLNKPDIVALSKGLTGGVLPLGLTVASDAVYEAFLGGETTQALLHGHSFTGNAIACAVACASLDLFGEKSTWDKIANISKWNVAFARELEVIGHVKNVRMCGTILAFEVGSDTEDSYFSDLKAKAYAHFLENGILLRPLGNTLFINPPYCMEEADYLQLKSVLLDFLLKYD